MSERIVLFDEGSTYVQSDIFAVLPKKIVVLTAWGFSATKKVIEPGEPNNITQRAIVEKLAFNGGGYFVGDPDCVCKLNTQALVFPDTQYAEDVTGCGVWNLSACWNVGIITLPGVYRLRFNDTGAPGSVIIYADIFNAEDVYIPPRLIFGGF